MSYEKPNLKNSILIISLTICLQWKAKQSHYRHNVRNRIRGSRLAENWGRGFIAERPSARADAALNDLQSQNSNADFTQLIATCKVSIRLEGRQKTCVRFAQKDWMCFATMPA